MRQLCSSFLRRWTLFLLRQAGNEIYLYEVLATNLLQAMLVRRAEQPHRQISNSSYPVEKSTWLDDHVAKQRTEAHVEVISFLIHRSKPT